MNKNMISGKIIKEMEPLLEGRVVKDLVVGLSLIGCQLDDGSVGVSYVHRDELPPGCGVFGFIQEVIGMNATEVAQWVVAKDDILRKAVGTAVLCAASATEDMPNDDKKYIFGIDFKEEDVVGMIGLIGPIANVIKKDAGKLIVFDKALAEEGGYEGVYDNSLQAELLPTCNKVIITGSSLINGTIDELLDMCKSAEEVVIVGTSTPMYGAGFAGTNVTSLAGSYWKSECKEEIFKIISLAGGIAHLQDYVVKKNLRIK